MKAKTDLAGVFLRIEQAAGAVEDIAKGILSAVKAAKATTLEQFNALVSAAYEHNGWSTKVGRPAPGTADKPAPDAVKLYVSSMRAAYRLDLDVLSFDTMGALRAAIRDKRDGRTTSERPPELRGVQVSSEHAMTGALLHDVVVLYEHLPTDEQAAFEASLRRLLARFTKAAPPELTLAA